MDEVAPFYTAPEFWIVTAMPSVFVLVILAGRRPVKPRDDDDR